MDIQLINSTGMKTLLAFLMILNSCTNAQTLNNNGHTIETRFNPPNGFVRTTQIEGSFAKYLSNLPLKSSDAPVKLYDGTLKINQNAHAAVIDLPIGNNNLHQCADAVMRLRAEYLWKNKQYNKIHFNLTNGFLADYNSWRSGNRLVVNGNKTYWKKQAAASDSYATFWSYLEMVFTYAGSLSLSKELVSVSQKDLKVGDIFIKGGSPGHVAIVVDIAIHPKTLEKVFLLAQSYMPAQETHVLKNLENPSLGAWFPANFGTTLITPEYTFYDYQIMRFKD